MSHVPIARLAVAALLFPSVPAVGGELEIDLATALERAHPPERATLIVDLRGVSFLDSTGLALLLRHDRKAAMVGGHMIVVKGPPQVQTVFEITGLSERLPMVDEPLG